MFLNYRSIFAMLVNLNENYEEGNPIDGKTSHGKHESGK